jgi:hypothetical protein
MTDDERLLTAGRVAAFFAAYRERVRSELVSAKLLFDTGDKERRPTQPAD